MDCFHCLCGKNQQQTKATGASTMRNHWYVFGSYVKWLSTHMEFKEQSNTFNVVAKYCSNEASSKYM